MLEKSATTLCCLLMKIKQLIFSTRKEYVYLTFFQILLDPLFKFHPLFAVLYVLCRFAFMVLRTVCILAMESELLSLALYK